MFTNLAINQLSISRNPEISLVTSEMFRCFSSGFSQDVPHVFLGFPKVFSGFSSSFPPVFPVAFPTPSLPRQNRTAILRGLVSFDKWSDSLGGRLGAPYADTFYLDAAWGQKMAARWLQVIDRYSIYIYIHIYIYILSLWIWIYRYNIYIYMYRYIVI